MDSISHPTVNLANELWRFVRSRFAFQAKQIKKVTGLPLAQCYDTVSIAHGFSSWRGMSKVLNAMCLMDGLEAYDDWSGDGPHVMPVRLCLALSDNIDQIIDQDNETHWKRLEQIVSRPPSSKGRDDMDAIDGLIQMSPLRTTLLYKAAWMSDGAPWSDGIIEEAYCCHINFADLWNGDEEKAFLATQAIFGTHPSQCENDQYEMSTASVRTHNLEVERILAFETPHSPILKDSAITYLVANRAPLLSIDTWRYYLRDVHPGSLDSCVADSFVPSLLIANAPHDAWISIGILRDNQSSDLRHFFIAGNSAFAPSFPKAVQLAACVDKLPSISKLTSAEAFEVGLPNTQAEWYLVQSA